MYERRSNMQRAVHYHPREAQKVSGLGAEKRNFEQICNDNKGNVARD